MKVELFEKYKKITSDEGKVLTSFKNGQNILDYSSYNVMYTPLTFDEKTINEISNEYDVYYKQEQENELLKIEEGKK